jgi:hypothetical protein
LFIICFSSLKDKSKLLYHFSRRFAIVVAKYEQRNHQIFQAGEKSTKYDKIISKSTLLFFENMVSYLENMKPQIRDRLQK